MRAGRPRSQGDFFPAAHAVEAAPSRFVFLRSSSWPLVDIFFPSVSV